MKRGVIIVAGGHGLRMGSALPKQFIPIGGRPVLMHTLELFRRWDASARLTVVLPESHKAYWQMLVGELHCTVEHQVAAGGDTRFHSVANGLALMGDCDLIGIHDGVRPLVATSVVEACFQEAAHFGAAVPTVPLTESIRQLTADGSHAVSRNDYCVVQTPQVFRADWLTAAYAQPYRCEFTDDASVVEALGKPVRLVAGNTENIKITTPQDLAVAERLLT